MEIESEDLCHPLWRDIQRKIEAEFASTPCILLHAQDAVIAHQFEQHDRAKQALLLIGSNAEARLRKLLRPFGITLPQK